jgi:hypothetical protein
MTDYPADRDDEWLDILAACALIGGNKPVHPSTYYRGVKAGVYPPPEKRGLNISRVNRRKLEAKMRHLAESEDPP